MVQDEKLHDGQGRSDTPPLSESSEYIVTFDGPEDPTHPYRWSRFTKLFISITVCIGTLIVSYTSAVFAPALESAIRDLRVGAEVGRLGTTLYVLGFAFGPVFWAPASELWGRKWPLTAAMLAGGTFIIGTAVAQNIQTLLICRFFGGVCGASQLTVVPGVLSDLYDNRGRGVAITLYALCVFCGPFGAPCIGGFIAESRLGWRWTLYIPAILSFANGALTLLCVRETFAPCLLVAKAQALRRQHKGNTSGGIHAAHERVEFDLRRLAEKYFTRPLRMLATEPILLLVSLYMSFVYGLTYCLLAGFPYVFEDIHGMRPGVGGLPFLALAVGQVFGVGFVLSQQKAYARRLAANDNVPVPEWRLTPTLVGAPVFAAGIFWFGWTGFSPEIHWAVPTVAGLFIGFGILCVFLPCFNYIVDAYLPLAASAVAANIILRSSIAAGFPLFSTQMFKGMGVQWACTLLGGLAALMIPIPIAFRIYGPRLRQKSPMLMEFNSSKA
ncbi:bicyclomycin resistance protein [Apiospora phragmitis]|uniref:Bicyclomycin resistance protein n=1 Tax=Apiospora phragmitis TaxID=2905665 RepID=A0ABR1VCH5_9PEZI